MKKPRVLIGSSICQRPVILEKFLSALWRLDLSAVEAAFRFIDDNQIPESGALLRALPPARDTAVWQAPPRQAAYDTDEAGHNWSDALVLRVAELKNRLIAYAVEQDFDYLFLIDSDLLIHPKLIAHLLAQEKEIISEIFWTAWQPGSRPMPNVWLYDTYEMAHPALGEDTRAMLSSLFLSRLTLPGVYEVGGLGACTLISVPALRRGLSFSPIRNVSFWGEDRWFCIRAAALGIPLYADTHFPAKHLYRESDLEGL